MAVCLVPSSATNGPTNGVAGSFEDGSSLGGELGVDETLHLGTNECSDDCFEDGSSLVVGSGRDGNASTGSTFVSRVRRRRSFRGRCRRLVEIVEYGIDEGCQDGVDAWWR